MRKFVLGFFRFFLVIKNGKSGMDISLRNLYTAYISLL